MNATCIPPRVLRGILPLWLAAVVVVRADVPDPIPSVRFRYEGQSQLTGSPFFTGLKTDYYWGEIDKNNSGARHYGYYFYPSDPNDNSAYTASIGESFALDAHTVLTCVKSIEISVEHVPRSLEDARAMLEECFSTREVHVQRYFETVTRSSQEKLMEGYSFLGLTPDGPIWRLTQPIPDSTGDKPAFEYTSKDGIEYRLAFDRQRSIFSKCSISLPDTQDLPGQPPSPESSLSEDEQNSQRQPFTYVSEIIDDKDGFLLTSTSTQNPSSPNAQVVQVTERIFDFELNRTDPIVMTLTPNNGDRIDSVGNPQIKFEWRDGKIAKVVNPYLVKDMEKVRFARSNHWLIVVNLVAIGGLLLLVYWKGRKRGGNILVFAICLSMADATCASEPYCGIYSLYGAAKSFGLDVDLQKLIDPQYISSQHGSTAQDLVKAAKSLGLEATALSGLGIDSLKAAEQPLILGSTRNYVRWW